MLRIEHNRVDERLGLGTDCHDRLFVDSIQCANAFALAAHAQHACVS
ncbi:MAG: hypothetical protein AAB426_05110 [Myxococcota bacterium]